MESAERTIPQPSRPQAEGPIHPGGGRRIEWRRIFAPLGAAALFIAKLGAKAKALIFLLPKLKLLTTAGSMVVSIAAYSLLWGWRFAVGFVLLIFVHEMGHVVQLRREGVKASAPMFIPFLGAVIWARSLGGNALAEARVGLAGPVVGGLASAVVAGVAALTDSNLLQALAFTGFFLNLFNLIPITPLDGGRAAAALSPWMWIPGLLMLVALAIVFPNPFVLLIGLVAALDFWQRWRHRKSPEGEVYYRVSPHARIIVAAVYLALIGLLSFGMAATHLPRTLNDT